MKSVIIFSTPPDINMNVDNNMQHLLCHTNIILYVHSHGGCTLLKLFGQTFALVVSIP